MRITIHPENVSIPIGPLVTRLWRGSTESGLRINALVAVATQKMPPDDVTLDRAPGVTFVCGVALQVWKGYADARVHIAQLEARDPRDAAALQAELNPLAPSRGKAPRTKAFPGDEGWRESAGSAVHQEALL